MKRIEIIGNVTKDAVVQQAGGKNVINFTVAVNERFKTRDGEKKERTSFINCAMWRDSTTIAQYILKGIKIYVDGNPEVESYVNKNQETIAYQKVIVDKVEFLGGGSNKTSAPPASSPSSGNNDNPPMPTPDDDLPF